MSDRGRGRGRDPHDREGAGRGRGRGGSSERPPYRDYAQPEWDDRYDSRDDKYRKRAGGGADDDWKDRRDRREPFTLGPPPAPGYRGERDFITPSSRHDRPPAPPSREGSRDSMNRGALPSKVRDQPVPSPRERGMIDKPGPAISRPVGLPTQPSTSLSQTFTREGQVHSPVRRASTISNQNEPSPVARNFTNPSPKHQKDSNMGPSGDAMQGTMAVSSWLQSMMQQHQGDGNGEQQYLFSELIQQASYTYYRQITCREELKAAQLETSKHQTHFAQFPAIRERYTSAEKAKEAAFNEANNACHEAASKLNVFLHSLSASAISKKSSSEVAKDALRMSKDALKTAEEGKRDVEDLGSRFKKYVDREATKPLYAEAETMQKLQQEVKTLKQANENMEVNFQKAMKGYDDKLEKFLLAQDGFKNELEKMREERELEKKRMNEAADERRREKEHNMEIDKENSKAEGVMAGKLSALEERVATMEKTINKLQLIKPEVKHNTKNSATAPPAEKPLWLTPDFQDKWNTLLEDFQKMQKKLVLCDEAVAKADTSMTAAHELISEEFGKLQESVDKLTSETNENSESLKKLSSSTKAALEKLPSDTSTLITTRISELKPQLQQELQSSYNKRFSDLDTRFSTIEKSTATNAKRLEVLPQSIQPLMERINALQAAENRLLVLENAREAIEIAIQGVNNHLNNFQFKEIAEKVANLIGLQRVTNVERELVGLKAQLQVLVTASQQGQKGPVQQVSQAGAQGGAVKQGQMKNGTEGPVMTNGTTGQPTSTGAPTPASLAQFQALQQQQQQHQQQHQQLSTNLQATANNLTAINSRVMNLENNLAHVHNVVHPLTLTSPPQGNQGQLPPRLHGLEKRLEAQEARLQSWSQIPLLTSNPPVLNRLHSLENKMRFIDETFNPLKDDVSKLHETIANVEIKLASVSAAVTAATATATAAAATATAAPKTPSGPAGAGGVVLPDGFLEEYAPGAIVSLTEELHDLKRQFEQKVDNNLKQWASKVKDNIQKINRDVKELTARIEEITGGVGMRGGDEMADEGVGLGGRRVNSRRGEPQRIGSLEPAGMGGRESSAARSGVGSRGDSMDADV